MPTVKSQKSQRSNNPRKNQVMLIASGDLRQSANEVCWAAQTEMEKSLVKSVSKCGFELVRAHRPRAGDKHGFIDSQKQGMEVFAKIDPGAPLIVAEAVWQYSHHVLAGLTTHRGPILTVANWSGQWPGLVGLLNLNGSLTKVGVSYSSLWSETFTDQNFIDKLGAWLTNGAVSHDISHVRPFDPNNACERSRQVGQEIAENLRRDKAILGVFDEGCMGMFNAIIPDHLLNSLGVFKERLSQSALYFEAKQVSETDAASVRNWLDQQGMTFHTGSNHDTDLTDAQILDQCRMYVAALRIADDFGCDAIGIVKAKRGTLDSVPWLIPFTGGT